MEKYQHFFKKFKDFLDKAEIHKRRGNNDFNPYLEMWSETNEVKLHSSLLCGFLDPQNNHYQGDVFLEVFLESIKWKGTSLKEWFGDTQTARVHREYNNIDIYITNGYKHIIVENKIWAGDQHKQIERYIEVIAKEQSQDSDNSESSEVESQSPQDESIAYENIAVLYLTLDGRTPSSQSLGKWQIKGDYLRDNTGNEVLFKAISYKDEILKWIEDSRNQVGCITSLNAALLFYKDVVQIITNTKENTMSIEKFLTQGNMQENMEIVFEILNKKEEIKGSYCKAIIEKYRERIEGEGFEIVETSNNERKNEWDCNTWKYPYMIKPKDTQQCYFFAFCIEHKKNNENNGYGVRLFGKDTLKNAEKLMSFLNITLDYWWLKRDSKTMNGVESSLQEFLDSNEIKALNEKLKSYQAYCDTQDKITKMFESSYTDYQTNISKNENILSVWHKDFDKVKLGFSISAWHDNKKQKICFGIYLDGDEYDTKQLFASLKEVLGVGDDTFHADVFDSTKQHDIYITLAQCKEINIADFTQENFIEFFESLKEKTDELNQKIQNDWVKSVSKLHKFVSEK